MIRCTKCGCLNEEHERACHECGCALAYGPFQAKPFNAASGTGVVLSLRANMGNASIVNVETAEKAEHTGESREFATTAEALAKPKHIGESCTFATATDAAATAKHIDGTFVTATDTAANGRHMGESNEFAETADATANAGHIVEAIPAYSPRLSTSRAKLSVSGAVTNPSLPIDMPSRTDAPPIVDNAATSAYPNATDESGYSHISNIPETPDTPEPPDSTLPLPGNGAESPSDSSDTPRDSGGQGIADICHAIVFILVTPIAYLIGESALMICAAAGLVVALLARTARKRCMDMPALFMHRAGQILCWWCLGVCMISLLMQFALGYGLFIRIPAYPAEALPTVLPSFSAWLR